MRSDTRLDSAVFQLTPTRTRCDLVIVANGKSEKLASGLLNPFLAHLKTAQDQIAKGGYSITLQPDHAVDTFWFTKGTVERFVRFVSTPEVLERVATIESEILQIEEAITIQGNENLGLSSLEDNHTKSTESTEGSKPIFDADSEKAIVLFKTGSNSNPPDSNGSSAQEENSKVQLLRVLETRKIVLQKEQGMAFARAAAAGFDMDHMTHLITFAECFGAARLKIACLKFVELWRVKHETGQWFEVEAEALSMRSGFSPFNASGIVLAADASKTKEFGEDLESNGNGADHSTDKRVPSDPQLTSGSHEYFQSQFQHTTYPPWAMQPPFQPYPMQGMPYYQNYPQGGPHYPPPYPLSEDPRFNTSQRVRRRRSMNSKDNDVNSEKSSRSPEEDESHSSESEEESSHDRKSHKRSGRSGKKKSGMVVIKNLNYITSKKHEKSGDESQSASDTEIYDSNKKSFKQSKKNDGEDIYGNDADSGNWQAFQSFLLRAEEKITSSVDGDMFANEKEPSIKRKQKLLSDAEPFVTSERDFSNNHEARIMEFDSVSGKDSRKRQVGSNDEMLASSEIERGLREIHLDSQFIEIESGSGIYRKMANDDFLIYGQGNQVISQSSLDPLAENEHEHIYNVEKNSYIATDDSFIVPHRSGSLDQFEAENRTPIDMDTEFPLRKEDSSNNTSHQISYEPDDLFMMPERANVDYIGYDPVDYDMEMPIEVAAKQESIEQEDALKNSVEQSKKSDKEKKLKGDSLEKRRREAMMRKGMNPKSHPLTEAQKRAEKLRAYKVDLQKAKRANEEEERKRLEALKIERQKRIAARSNSNTIQSPIATKQIKPSPTKTSPNSSKISKFSDSEPAGSNSPLRKVLTRNNSIGSIDSPKTTKMNKLSSTSNGLTKSVSSLPEVKATTSRAKRLSDPTIRNGPSQKSTSNEKIPKKETTNGPQMKKISAIVQLDKTKSATLPELKIRTPKSLSDMKEGIHMKEGIQENKSNVYQSSVSNSDDNPVIEKTVVMLENEMVNGSKSETLDATKEKSGTDSDYAAIRAPPSPIIAVEIDVPNQKKPDEQHNFFEVVNNIVKEDSHNIPNAIPEDFYPVPYARASSIEEPASDSLEHTEQPTIESELVSIRTRSIKARVPNYSDSNLADQTSELVEKLKSKESKGIRKLLKFGRKSSASGEVNNDSDGSVIDEQIGAGSSNDANMLKNLISQDDTHAGGAPAKAHHRPFSILSPFRGTKSSEKKLAS